MTEETLNDQMTGIVKSVARRYHTRCWWSDLRDLEQEAWLVVLELASVYDKDLRGPDGEIDRRLFGAWAYRAAMQNLSRYLWRQSAPVTVSDQACKEMRGVHHHEVSPLLECVAPSVEDVVADLEVTERVLPKLRERIVFLYVTWMPLDEGWRSHVDAALEIYMDGVEPRDAAKKHGLDIRDLYKTTEYLRDLMRWDLELRNLLKDLKEGRL